MGRDFRVDIDDLRSAGQRIHSIAAEARAVVSRMRTASDRARSYWGDDEPGRAFAETYVPDSALVLSASDRLATALQATSDVISDAVAALVEQDLHAGKSLIASSAAGQAPVSRVDFHAATTSSPAEAPTSPVGSNESRVDTVIPNAVRSLQQPMPLESSGTTYSVRPTEPPGNDSQRVPVESAGAGLSPFSRTPVRQQRTPPLTPAASPIGPSLQKDGRLPGTGTWPPAARSEASSPTPRMPVKATSPASPSATRLSRRQDTHKPAGQHLSPTGLEISGVQAWVWDEIFCAVDDVLGVYPWLGVHSVGIAELHDGECIRTQWKRGSEQAGAAIVVDTVLLAARVGRDPDRFVAEINEATSEGYLVAGSQLRPVYSTVVRGLGHAFDVVGGFAARSNAQRRLLKAYLDRERPQRTSIAEVVTGFRQWRNQLSGRCFHGQCFSSAGALSEAFTDVWLNGEASTPPARALHHMLIEAARSTAADGATGAAS